jgi:glycosyltransferase involved in cell wall biosynthesis
VLPCGRGAGAAALPCQHHGPEYPALVPPAQGSPRHDERTPVVWFVNQYAGSPHHGMEFRHYELGRQLVELGARVVVISGSYSHLFAHQPAVRATYQLEEVDGLTYCWVRVPPYSRAMSVGRVRNMVVFMLRLFRLPTRRLPAPDAIVVSSPSPFPILPASLWTPRTGRRLIFEVRDVWPLTLQELGGLSRLHPLVAVMGWFERFAYRAADTVVSVFPAAAPHYAAKGMAPSKLRVVPNGASPDAFLEPTRPTPEDVRVVAESGAFTVGFVGTLAVANAIEPLIEAARLLANEDVRFVIVGHGSEDGRLRTLAADLPNVTFLGPVDKPDVPATLRAFDLCYIGYHRSTLYRFGISSNKVFDYMAASRPIVLAADAVNDWVQAAGCGITVPPDDPGALAAAIRTMAGMSAPERSRLGANGRAFVEREHDYAVLARRYLPILTGEG